MAASRAWAGLQDPGQCLLKKRMLKQIGLGVNNVEDEVTYRMNCVKRMFPNTVTSQEIKRLKHEKDTEKMRRIRKAIFKGVPMPGIWHCERFGIKTISNMQEVETHRNITSVFNFRAKQVNSLIHKKVSKKTLVNGVEIWKGLTTQCKQHFKAKGGSKTFVNNLYRIDGFAKFIRIVDMPDESIAFNNFMERQQLWNTFSLSYCSTCHAEQGCSINEGLIIFDSNTPYVNRYWMYTALTRCKDLSASQYFLIRRSRVWRSPNWSNTMTLSSITKLMDARSRAMLLGGELQKTIVIVHGSTKNLQSVQFFNCFHCQKAFEFKLADGSNVHSDLTFDKLDDSLGHVKDNLVLSCKYCSCCKSK